MWSEFNHITILSDSNHTTMWSEFNHITILSDSNHITMWSEFNHITILSDSNYTTMRSYSNIILLFGQILYWLMHALFHTRTVVIPRDRYRPEGFSPSVDIGRWTITVLIWKKACINLFIPYFNIELNRTKLTSHTYTKLMYMSDRYRLRDDNSPDMEKGMHWSIYHIFQHRIKKNKIKFSHTPNWCICLINNCCVTSWGSRKAWYRIIRVLPRYLPMVSNHTTMRSDYNILPFGQILRSYYPSVRF
jgi:hypothetical protein